MSAVRTEIDLPVAARVVPTPTLPGRALAYLALVAAAAAAVALPSLAQLTTQTPGWPAFFALAGGAAIVQLFVVRTPGNQSYQATSIFLIAAILILKPELVVLMPLAMLAPQSLKERNPWHIASFNVCNYTLSALAALFSARFVLHAQGAFTNPDLRIALAGAVACVVFVGLSQLLRAPMLHLARGDTFRETGLFAFESLSTEFVLATLGVGIAVLWQTNKWLIPFAVAPLLLVHRSLSVPALQEEARVDPKTGLFNARHFSSALREELGRSARFQRPLSLIMADLDLLRDINNSYGHLAGDAVLKGIADVFRLHLRQYDVPARFGGEEFAILLPETPPEQAFEIADRIRQATADMLFDVETSSEPIRATVSIGVAAFPRDGTDANELIHQADLAVYRAKLQGRNCVLDASVQPLVMPKEARGNQLASVPEEETYIPTIPPASDPLPDPDMRHPRPHALHSPRFLSLSRRLAAYVALVTVTGIAAGIAGLVWGASHDVLGLLAVVALVAIGQALALELDDGTISVSAVGALAGAALFGPRAALALAVTTSLVDWSARRSPLHRLLFNVGTLSLASLAAAGIFGLCVHSGVVDSRDKVLVAAAGVLAGAAYFAVNMGLLSLALAIEGHERWWRVWQERFAWLLPHYLVYGFIGGVIAIAYDSAHLFALAVFAVPLLLMRKTQEAYLRHTQKSTQKLREATATIQNQNASLERANRLLRERSTAAMESLSATVDARDAYTAGHSRRVQRLALAVGRQLGLTQSELDLLGHAALFHDIGKLAVPDSILLKPATLTDEEWALMQRHADEGARIIDRLGFLGDAVPAIRYHHERYDGSGYPEGLSGEDIPLGARIIHVADALDSMLTTRIYQSARPLDHALQELRRAAGTQFCPRCVAALEQILPVTEFEGQRRPRLLAV
jgi:diguanylate cyclase (GGDEF)-like protein/putative nucleotidyltransferase with HDIG domain